MPVVASPVGVNSDIVEHGVNGFLAETNEEWSRAIKILLNNADLRRQMGSAGQKKLKSIILLKFGVLELLKCYKTLSKNKLRTNVLFQANQMF